MGAAHTPGTWAVVRPTDAFGHPTVCAFDGDPADGVVSAVIAEVLSEAEGDPDLIAAAPKLVQAAMAFAAHYPMGVNPFLDDAYRAARVAIAKAEGRSDG